MYPEQNRLSQKFELSAKNMARIELYQKFYYICSDLTDLTTKTSRYIGNRLKKTYGTKNNKRWYKVSTRIENVYR